jgi:serine phosphatase RsbU (regulator of sigma subunit)
VDCLDLGNCHAIIVGDMNRRDSTASGAVDSVRAYTRNLVKLRVALPIGLRLTSDFFARTVMTDSAVLASLFIAVVDLRKESMQYASAGFEVGLLFDGDGSHVHLEPTGPMLGLRSPPAFGERVLPLRRNSTLVVVTDGITTARPPDGDDSTIFGSRGVAAAVQDSLRHGSDPALAIFNAAARQACGQLVDDATVLVSSLLAPRRMASEGDRLQPARASAAPAARTQRG